MIRDPQGPADGRSLRAADTRISPDTEVLGGPLARLFFGADKLMNARLFS
jgi:hypothetical protein